MKNTTERKIKAGIAGMIVLTFLLTLALTAFVAVIAFKTGYHFDNYWYTVGDDHYTVKEGLKLFGNDITWERRVEKEPGEMVFIFPRD